MTLVCGEKVDKKFFIMLGTCHTSIQRGSASCFSLCSWKASIRLWLFFTKFCLLFCPVGTGSSPVSCQQHGSVSEFRQEVLGHQNGWAVLGAAWAWFEVWFDAAGLQCQHLARETAGGDQDCAGHTAEPERHPGVLLHCDHQRGCPQWARWRAL